MRIVIDLDGTICEIRKPNQDYANVKPKMAAVRAIRTLKREGHSIIIYTARHMKTCDGNVGAVIERVGSTTLKWLRQHGVQYDEIHFGKPWGEIYVDDQAMPPMWGAVLAKARKKVKI